MSGGSPSGWKEAIVIPILQFGKDPTNHILYPIALTNCICKTMEQMVNCRLVYCLDSHKLLTNVQCGFESKCSMVDNLVSFETYGREAFIHNHNLISEFIFIGGARCSSVVRAFAHGAMCRQINPSWGGLIELFLVPASAP